MRKFSAYGPSLMVLATAMLVLFLGPTVVQHLTYKQTEARMIRAAGRLDSTGVLERLNQAYADIAALVEPTVVHISAQQPLYSRGDVSSLSTGSGWIYDESGAVVTNYHVVKAAERIEVQLASGELREAEMVGFDRSTDIAVLKIPAGHLHAAVRASAREPVRQGDLVFAFGSPFDFRFSMSSGIVSGQGRSADVLGRTGYENFIQVDAAINPGNSGGPLTDYRGRVIGMNTAIATSRRGSLEEGQFAGVGLAIPLQMIEPVVNQILEKGFVEKGYLGVNIDEVPRSAQRSFGFIGNGVLVTGVEPDSPADRAGLVLNDIITAVDDVPVASTDQLRSTISSMLPGETVSLTIFRPDPATGSGRTYTLSVTLKRLNALRASGMLPIDQPTDRIEELGIARMATSTPEIAANYGVPYREGVLLQRLVSGSRLAQRVLPGSTIVTVRDRPIGTAEQFVDLLRQEDLSIGVQVDVVLPDGTPRNIMLRAES